MTQLIPLPLKTKQNQICLLLIVILPLQFSVQHCYRTLLVITQKLMAQYLLLINTSRRHVAILLYDIDSLKRH